MLYEVTSQRTQPEIESALEESAKKHKFGIMTVHDLKKTMANKGVEFDGECWVYEVCNPHQAKKVLEANASVSTALPCRISLYRVGDGYRLATIRPSVLLGMLGVSGLEPVAREVEQVMIEMMQDAAG